MSHDGGIPALMHGRNFVPNPPGIPPGLYILPEWITPAEEQEIVDFISKGQWSDHISGKRLTQHYGYRYSIGGYKASDEKLAVDWGVLQRHSDRLQADFPGINIVQCLVNAYRKDTGISSHRDESRPIVFGLSLVGDINMRWAKISDRKQKYEAFIPARSLYIMCNDAALEWEHEVPSLSTVRYPDPQNNNALTRVVKKPDWYIRASITYRHFNQPIGPDRLTIPTSNPTYNH
jgi:alkylated DNA repair dioxygenase AlkB